MNTSPARAFSVFIDKAGVFTPWFLQMKEWKAQDRVWQARRRASFADKELFGIHLFNMTVSPALLQQVELKPSGLAQKMQVICPKIDANIRKQPGFLCLLLQHQKLDVFTPRNALHVLNGPDALIYSAGVKAQRRL